MMKKLKWVLAGAVVIFVALQFFNPPHSNPAVKADFIAAARFHPRGLLRLPLG